MKEKQVNNEKETFKSKRADLFEWNSNIDKKYGLVLKEENK